MLPGTPRVLVSMDDAETVEEGRAAVGRPARWCANRATSDTAWLTVVVCIGDGRSGVAR